MTHKRITGGSEFEEHMSYSRAVVHGDYVFVSGTTGFDYQAMSIPDDAIEQTEQCFMNIARALQNAGSSLEDVVRVRYIYANRRDFQPCWPVIKKYLGQARPAATMIVAELLDERMKVEIEVTAALPTPF